MISYEISESIKASPDRVFRYLSSVDLYPRWMAIKSAEIVTPEIRGRGLRWRSRTREGAFLIENDVYEENRTVGYRTIDGPFDWVGGFRLKPMEDGSTQITSYGQIRLSGVRRLLEPVMGGQVRKGETAELATLKALVEAEP